MYCIDKYKRYLYIITLDITYALTIYIYFIYQSIILTTTPLYSSVYSYSKGLEKHLLNNTISSLFTFDENIPK